MHGDSVQGGVKSGVLETDSCGDMWRIRFEELAGRSAWWLRCGRLPFTSAGLPILLAVFLPAASSAFHLATRLSLGHAYRLELVSRTTTRASSEGGSADHRFVEQRVLRYDALVTPMKSRPSGGALLERHDDVQLRSEGSDGTTSLFPPGTRLDVRLDPDGGTQVSVGGNRLPASLERVVSALLDGRLGHLPLASLLDPGHPVEEGDTWEVAPARIRRLFASFGFRVVLADRPGSVRALRIPDASEDLLSLDYAMPVAWLRLGHLPEDIATSRTSACLKGRITISRSHSGTRISHESRLDVDLRGVVIKPVVSNPFPVALRRSVTSSETIVEDAQNDAPARPAPN